MSNDRVAQGTNLSLLLFGCSEKNRDDKCETFWGATKTVYSSAIIQLIHVHGSRADSNSAEYINQSYFLKTHSTNLGVYHPNDHQNPQMFYKVSWKEDLKQNSKLLHCWEGSWSYKKHFNYFDATRQFILF